MNPPTTLYAMLQVIAIVLVFLSAFLALFLGMIVCLIAVEFSRAGLSMVRGRVTKRPSLTTAASPRMKESHTWLRAA